MYNETKKNSAICTYQIVNQMKFKSLMIEETVRNKVALRIFDVQIFSPICVGFIQTHQTIIDIEQVLKTGESTPSIILGPIEPSLPFDIRCQTETIPSFDL